MASDWCLLNWWSTVDVCFIFMNNKAETDTALSLKEESLSATDPFIVPALGDDTEATGVLSMRVSPACDTDVSTACTAAPKVPDDH